MERILQVHLFGSPNIVLGSSRVGHFPTERIRLLFFYLLLFRECEHTRSRLAGLFWGDSSETQARHALSTALWRLRQWLKSLPLQESPALLVDDHQITFNTSDLFQLDVTDFEEQITHGRQLQGSAPDQAAVFLRRAVELYRGELLEGCYADWCLVERNRLHELYLQTLLHLMVYHGGQREYDQAIVYAKRILTDDPLREEVQRELIKLFLLNQQPAEALQQYRRCERALKEELGIQPMPETQALYQQWILQSNGISDELARSIESMPRALIGQTETLAQKIGIALKHFEIAREELNRAIETLRQTQTEMNRDAGNRPK